MITWKTPLKVVKTAGGNKSNQLSKHKDDQFGRRGHGWTREIRSKNQKKKKRTT